MILLRLKSLNPHRSLRWVLELTLIVLVWFSIKTYLQRDLVSGIAPELTATLLNGQTVVLQAYQGHPLLLHFWATWCSICKLEQTSIEQISKSHSVITVAMNSGSAADINRYLKNHALDFPVIADPYSDIAKRFGVGAVPTSFVIDSQGRIAFTETGYSTEWGLRLSLWLATARY